MRGRPRLEGGEEERRKRARARVRQWKARHGWQVTQQKARAYARRHKKKSTPCGVVVELRFDEPRRVERSYGELRYEPCDEGGYALGGGGSADQGRVEAVRGATDRRGNTAGELHGVEAVADRGTGDGISGVELGGGSSEERRVNARLAELRARRKREGVKVELVL
jgi:hypothetical protein